MTDRTVEIERVFKALKTIDPARVLAAMGHPGYGPGFANWVLKEWAGTDRGLHDVVFGGSARSAKGIPAGWTGSF